MPELTFQEEIRKIPVNIARAALCFSKEIAYPDLQVGYYITLIEQLSAWSGKIIQPNVPVFMQARELADFLYHRFGFLGNAKDYEDPRNSYLNEVLERRLGIPISLSVIYVAIAQSLGLSAFGVGLPGHFIVGVRDPLGVVYFDPFHEGRQLSMDDCARLVEATAGLQGGFQKEWLAPADPLDILARMLNNLRNVYLKLQAWPQLLGVIERLHLLQPEQPGHLRDLGLIYHQLGSLRQAIQFYKEYLRGAPNAHDAEAIRSNLQAAAQRMARRN